MQSESGKREDTRKAVTLTCGEKGFSELLIVFEWLRYVELFFMKKAMKCDFYCYFII